MESPGEDEHTAQLWRDLVDNSVECELCNEPYADDDVGEHVPRLLNCGHTFCQSCLEDWATVGANTGASSGAGGDYAVMDCPTCRRRTTYKVSVGARSLPKNYELLRVRQEIESYTQAQLQRLKEAWYAQVQEKEQLAKEAEEHARVAQRESVQASQRAVFLARQVEMNEQEKKRAQELAEEARHRALVASKQAEALQAETERLKQRLQHEAQQLARVQSDATSAAQVAQELHNKAENLQRQVDCVRAQLSLHAGRHDPTKLVVLVGEPTTVGSWLLPYTRYAVLSVATDSMTNGADASTMDPFRVAKTWTMMRQVGEPTACVKVYRRYSDFLWLHHELQREFPFELVPCVPGKQLFFNKEKEFVGERMRLLQAFLRDVLRVPALATTEQVRAFLLATTEELEQLRQATRMFHQNDKFSVEEDDGDVFSDDLDGLPEHSTSSASSTNGANGVSTSASTNAWSAWGAVSAITSSAAKLVTTTGTALTGLSNGMTGASASGGANGSGVNGGSNGFPDSIEHELSRSLLADEHGKLPPLAEKRRKYIELTRAYESAAQKGSQLSRAERQESHHLHRLCELMHEMNALDQSFARKRGRGAAPESMSTTWRDGDNDEEEGLSLRFESRPFDERASEAFSSISLMTKNNADCMEYALLEVVRMQMLELGGIEDAFSRVRDREELLNSNRGNGASTSLLGSPGTSDSGNGSFASTGTSNKREELAQHRRELEKKVNALEPSRTQFVFDTLNKNSLEMLKLVKMKRKLYEASRKQLRSGP